MTQDFLDKIWGDTEGYRCVVSGKMRHAFYQDQSQVSDFKSQLDHWFAPTIFNSQTRKAENAVSSKAFYLDIDCKEGSYEGITDACAAVLSFIEDCGLPSPTIVRSGNGIHVYFVLDKPVQSSRWLRTAKALQLACIEHGLKADHSVTKDIARILRVPGTFNYKDPKNPKPVELLTDITECTYEQLEEALSEYVYRVDLSDVAKEENARFAIDLPNTPKDAGQIAEGCGQLRRFRDSQGNLPEPHWYAGLGVLALCVDGEETAQAWSSGHPNYSKRATAAKFERAKEFAPTTCSKFAEVNPDGCKGCPYAGKITSPIQLGETLTAIDSVYIPTQDGQFTSGIYTASNNTPEKLPPPLAPEPYKVGKEGVYILIPATDTEPPVKEAILFHPLWVSRVMSAELGGSAEIELMWDDQWGERQSAQFAVSLLSSPQVFEGALGEHIITFFPNIRNVITYIKKGIQHWAKHNKKEIVYGKFGFTEDRAGFVIGTDIIRSGSRGNANISTRIDRDQLRRCSEKGSLDSWREATRLIDEPRFWPHRMCVLSCFGSPLLALSGNEGSVLSLAGVSGGGKTTAADIGISAFAEPEAFNINPRSTLKSFYERWRQAGNLPVAIHEAATISKELLSILTLDAANGKARDTMTQDSRLNNSGSWKTLTILTSNQHLLEFSSAVLPDAAKARILEIPFTSDSAMPLSIGRPVHSILRKNHGIAGRLFLDYVMAHQDEIACLVDERVQKLEPTVDSVHRYNVWLIAAASVAGEIAQALGLIDFQIEDAIENAIKVLKHQSDTAKPLEDRIFALISEYTNKYQESIGAKADASNGWLTPPRGEARGRVDFVAGIQDRISIPVKMLKQFAMEEGLDARSLDEALPTKKNVRLSAVGTQVHCYVISPWPGD